MRKLKPDRLKLNSLSRRPAKLVPAKAGSGGPGATARRSPLGSRFRGNDENEDSTAADYARCPLAYPFRVAAMPVAGVPIQPSACSLSVINRQESRIRGGFSIPGGGHFSKSGCRCLASLTMRSRRRRRLEWRLRSGLGETRLERDRFRLNSPSRLPRESGGPGPIVRRSPLGPRFRGDDENEDSISNDHALEGPSRRQACLTPASRRRIGAPPRSRHHPRSASGQPA